MKANPANPPCCGQNRGADMRKPESGCTTRKFGTPAKTSVVESKAPVAPLADPAQKRGPRSAAKDPGPKPQPKKESLIGRHRVQKLSDITADERLPVDIRSFLASLEK